MNHTPRASRWNLPLTALTVYLLLLGMITAAHGMHAEALVMIGTSWVGILIMTLSNFIE